MKRTTIHTFALQLLLLICLSLSGCKVAGWLYDTVDLFPLDEDVKRQKAYADQQAGGPYTP